ncbi:Ribonuclease 3-like protein 2 [Forsythia ovata]|uniref:Ribonuclease 3-like protein 2 n=1 Tax=Forsythia ovata TaxID=205694 RepID=A0ABD1R6L2_9LAMI
MESPVNYTYNLPPEDDDNQEILDMADSVRAVEKLLNYNFSDKKLLEEALTHSSYTGSASYQRLEFVGDSALGLAITNYIFLAYPEVDPGKLSLVRASNISTEKLARVAIRHGLYKYVRHNATALDEKVMEFAIAIQEEDDAVVHGGLMKAPKVLADIVESVAAAVYVDSNFNLKDMWMVIRDLLEPIVTLDMVEQQPQPVTMLFELCQKDGKQVDIRHWRKGDRNVASVYVDGYFVASASAEQKENAKLHAAKAALQKLSYKSSDMMGTDIFSELNGEMEIEGAKQKLHELCGKIKWPRPDYKVDREVGRSHEKKYVCSVQIKINESVLLSTGSEKTRIRDAENSAASAMLYGLRESKYI